MESQRPPDAESKAAKEAKAKALEKARYTRYDLWCTLKRWFQAAIVMSSRLCHVGADGEKCEYKKKGKGNDGWLELGHDGCFVEKNGPFVLRPVAESLPADVIVHAVAFKDAPETLSLAMGTERIAAAGGPTAIREVIVLR